MSDVLIVSKEARIRGFMYTAPAGDVRTIRVLPGANLLSNEKLEILAGIDAFQDLVTRGKFEIKTQGTGDQDLRGKVQDISNLTVDAALKAVDKADMDQVKAFLDQDARPEVREALIERYAELEDKSDEAKEKKSKKK